MGSGWALLMCYCPICFVRGEDGQEFLRSYMVMYIYLSFQHASHVITLLWPVMPSAFHPRLSVALRALLLRAMILRWWLLQACAGRGNTQHTKGSRHMLAAAGIHHPSQWSDTPHIAPAARWLLGSSRTLGLRIMSHDIYSNLSIAC